MSRRATPGRALTAAVTGILGYVALDAATGGPVTALEARHCAEPALPPAWARGASVLAEREVLTAAALVVAANRLRTGDEVVTPIARLVGGALAARCRREPAALWGCAHLHEHHEQS